MNIFRLFGDLSHLLSILILIYNMRLRRSSAGISFKSQSLYAMIFVTRYLDLFWSWVSLYNTAMKVFFVGSSLYILYLMKFPFRPTHDPNLDTFKVEFLLIGSFVTSMVCNYEYSFSEILWSFSIWLESVAILPQLFIIQRTGEAENITTHYLFALGAYRALYIPNWIYRYVADDYWDPIALAAGIVQTALYADFAYIYVTKVLKGEKFELPA